MPALDHGESHSLWPETAAVLNFSVPNPLPEKILSLRPDVKFCEGDLLAYDPAKTTLG